MSLREIWSSGIHMPVALWWVALIVAAILIRRFYYSVYRGQPARHLWWLRFAAVALILFALADLTRQRFSVQLPDLVIAFDDSQSISLPHDQNVKSRTPDSRLEIMQSILTQDRLHQLAKQYQLQFWKLDEKATQLAAGLRSDDLRDQLAADQPASRIGDGMVQILENQAGRHTAAILLFSDGAVTDGKSLAAAGIQAGQQSIPVFTVGLGNPLPAPNLALANLNANSRVRVNEPMTVTIDLVADSLKDEPCQIVVSDKETGEQIFQQEIQISSDQFRRSIPLRIINDSAVSRTLVISASSTFDESNTTDNQLEHSVQVVEGKTRVLIVQDFPGPWYRFLKETLLRAVDPDTGESAFDVHTLLQQASADFDKIDATARERFPVNELQDYDLIVIGDARLDAIGQQRGLTDDDCAAIENYVRNLSGNLVLVPGTRNFRQMITQSSLARLMPLNPSGEPGVLSETTWRLEFLPVADGLGPMRGNRESIGKATPARFHIFPVQPGDGLFTTVAEFQKDDSADSWPAITLQRYGTGTSITHFSDELYRLRYRSDENLYAGYWIRLVTELAAERLQKRDVLALLTTDAMQYIVGVPVNISAEIFDPTVDPLTTSSIDILMTDENGLNKSIELQQVEPGVARYQALIGQLVPGDYRLILATAGFDSAFVETRFAVSNETSELKVLNQQQDDLVRLSTNSSGIYVDAGDIEQLWPRLPRGRWNQVGTANYRPIWSWPWIPPLFAMLVIGLLAVEWVMRRKLRLE